MYDLTATQPTPPRRRTGRTVLIVVAVVVAVCCIAGVTATLLGGALAEEGRAGNDALIGAAGDGSAPDLPGLNQPVRDGQFEFVVRSASCGKTTLDNGWLHAQAKGQFCVITMTVTNIGREARRFADGIQLAVGPKGEHYAADTGAGVVANGDGGAVWEVVNPGISIEVKVVYDIPVGATISLLVLHDAGLSGGVQVTVAAG